MATSEQQLNWLRESAGVYVTNDRVVHVRGEDAVSWLNGQVTADVRSLTPGHAVYALTVSLKGRIHADLWALRNDEGLSIVLPGACAETALAELEKHIIMEDVELSPQDGLRVVTVQGPHAGDVLAVAAQSAAHYTCARFPSGAGDDLWLSAAELPARVDELTEAARRFGGGLVDEAGWAHAHVALAVPRAGVDFGVSSYPQEAGLKARAVSFSKGCYTGQEVVYMLEKRGQVARRLVQLAGPGAPPAAGTPVLDAGGQRVGEVTSATQAGPLAVALAYLKRAHAEPAARVRLQDAEWEVRCVVGETGAGCPIVAST